MSQQPREAVEKFLKGELTGIQLLRSLASYEHWLVPASFAGGAPCFRCLEIEGEQQLCMFSDLDGYDACKAILGGAAVGDHYLDLTGDSVWLNIPCDAQAVSVNTYGAQAIYYKHDQFQRLIHWGEVVRVERALENFLTSGKGHEVIRDFRRYRFGYSVKDGKRYMMLAPDSKGRKLVAIFTAKDAVEAFASEYGAPTFVDSGTDGQTLFSELSRLPLDGIVFNCCGPTTPRAFAIGFAREILEKM